MKCSLRFWARELRIDPATLSRRFKQQGFHVPRWGITLLQLVGNNVIHRSDPPVEVAMTDYWSNMIARWEEQDRRKLRWLVSNGMRALFEFRQKGQAQ